VVAKYIIANLATKEGSWVNFKFKKKNHQQKKRNYSWKVICFQTYNLQKELSNSLGDWKLVPSSPRKRLLNYDVPFFSCYLPPYTHCLLVIKLCCSFDYLLLLPSSCSKNFKKPFKVKLRKR